MLRLLDKPLLEFFLLLFKSLRKCKTFPYLYIGLSLLLLNIIICSLLRSFF